MRKTLLASSILLAFSWTTAAADWENPVLEFDGTNESAMNEAYTHFVYNDKGLPSGATTLNADETGYVTSKNLMQGSGTPNYGGAPVFMQSNDTNTEVVNNGKIWVVGNSDTEGAYVAEGMGTSGNSAEQSVTNNGTIFVDGKNNSAAYMRIKGMSAIRGQAINAETGNIVVKNGGVAMIDNTNDGLTEAVVLENKGTITVLDSDATSIGMFFRKFGNAEVSNSGSIIAQGENSIGVVLGADKNDTTKVFTNTGTISAEKTAIFVDDELTAGSTINFTDGSKVDGLVDANEHTTLNFTNNTDTISLADDAQAINTTGDSNVTIVQGTEQGLEIDSVNVAETSSLGFRLNDIGSEGNEVLIVNTVEGEVGVTYTGTVSDKLADGADAKDLFNGIKVGADNTAVDAVTVEEGLWGNGGVYYSNGDVQITSVNSLLSSTTDLALMNGLVWRSQLTNLSDRMGTLRTMPQAAGAWARYNNGRLDGRGIQYDYNTIEIGFDAPVSSNFLVGVALDYTIGETDLNAGSADNDTYTLGLYGTYFGDNGGFVDLMAKIGRIDNEYDISNNSGVENGDYMMTGAIVGVEAGHRFDLAYNTFVEPQVQLSYSWLRASDYSTNVRSVDFETVESLVARVGVMGGIKFAENRGAAYLKASYNHDFLGDVDAEYTALDGSLKNPLKISDELDDNWAEVSLGLNYSVTDQFNTFLDVGTGYGGDIDQKWRVNVGARYTF